MSHLYTSPRPLVFSLMLLLSISSSWASDQTLPYVNLIDIHTEDVNILETYIKETNKPKKEEGSLSIFMFLSYNGKMVYTGYNNLPINDEIIENAMCLYEYKNLLDFIKAKREKFDIIRDKANAKELKRALEEAFNIQYFKRHDKLTASIKNIRVGNIKKLNNHYFSSDYFTSLPKLKSDDIFNTCQIRSLSENQINYCYIDDTLITTTVNFLVGTIAIENLSEKGKNKDKLSGSTGNKNTNNTGSIAFTKNELKLGTRDVIEDNDDENSNHDHEEHVDDSHNKNDEPLLDKSTIINGDNSGGNHRIDKKKNNDTHHKAESNVDVTLVVFVSLGVTVCYNIYAWPKNKKDSDAPKSSSTKSSDKKGVSADQKEAKKAPQSTEES